MTRPRFSHSRRDFSSKRDTILDGNANINELLRGVREWVVRDEEGRDATPRSLLNTGREEDLDEKEEGGEEEEEEEEEKAEEAVKESRNKTENDEINFAKIWERTQCKREVNLVEISNTIATQKRLPPRKATEQRTEKSAEKKSSTRTPSLTEARRYFIHIQSVTPRR